MSLSRIAIIGCTGLLLFGLPVRCSAQYFNAPDSPCARFATTLDLANCFYRANRKADADLNATYQELIKRLKDPDSGGGIEQLQSVQRLWIKFRDSNCMAAYEQYGGGTAGPIAKLSCLEAMTRHRTEELRIVYVLTLKD